MEEGEEGNKKWVHRGFIWGDNGKSNEGKVPSPS
jgi:hypothetical protein